MMDHIPEFGQTQGQGGGVESQKDKEGRDFQIEKHVDYGRQARRQQV